MLLFIQRQKSIIFSIEFKHLGLQEKNLDLFSGRVLTINCLGKFGVLNKPLLHELKTRTTLIEGFQSTFGNLNQNFILNLE
jgi:hypothetical protein